MKGYSLFELLVVLLFLGVLLKNLPKIELPATRLCQRLSSFLENAQNKAIQSGKPVTVEFLNDPNAVKELDSKNLLLLPKNSALKAVNFGNLIYGTKSITFEPELWTSAGSVTITSKNNSCKLYQSILGAKRIE